MGLAEFTIVACLVGVPFLAGVLTTVVVYQRRELREQRRRARVRDAHERIIDQLTEPTVVYGDECAWPAGTFEEGRDALQDHGTPTPSDVASPDSVEAGGTSTRED